MSSPPASSRSERRTLAVELPESVVQLLGPAPREAARHLTELAFIELFRRGETSSGWAAEQLEISKDDFRSLLAEHDVSYIDMSEDELREQVESAMSRRARSTS
jgi:hypothetical protein